MVTANDIVGSLPDGVVTIDSSGIVTCWNRALETLTGHAAATMLGRRSLGVLQVCDADGEPVELADWRAADEDAPDAFPTELRIRAADGTTVPVACSYAVVADGADPEFVVVVRRPSRDEELDAIRADLMAVVAHELRTPLAPVSGWAQTLLTRGDRLSDDERRAAIQAILDQAGKLEALLGDILDASRGEPVSAVAVTDVSDVAARVVADTRAAHPKRLVRFRVTATPCHVRGAAVWVERAITNLVSNAVKYSPDRDPVDVVVGAHRNDVVVAVADRGPGIAAADQAQIFERFVRLDGTGETEGTGLGLYLTRRIARGMGGDVTVSSTVGVGATFQLRLPAAPIVPRQRRVDVSGRASDDLAPTP